MDIVSKLSSREFKAGISSAVFGKTFGAEELTEAYEAGLQYVEIATNQSIRDVPAEEVDSRMVKFAEAVAESGIGVWSVHLPFSGTLDISVTDGYERKKNVEFIATIMRRSAELYSPQRFVLHPSSEPIDGGEREARIACSIESIRELKQISDELQIALCVENLPRTCLGNTPEELVRIVDSVPGVFVCFDTNHYSKGTPEHFLKVVGPRIKTVHLSDYDLVNECHWLPYDGDIDWESLLKNLVGSAEYDGVLMFESWKRADGSQCRAGDIAASFAKMQSAL